MEKILLLTLIFVLSYSGVNCQGTTIPTAPTVPTSPAPFCPPEGIHHRPTDHCQYFIICINGAEHLGRCSDGFLFDEITNSCQPATIVDCGTRTRP